MAVYSTWQDIYGGIVAGLFTLVRGPGSGYRTDLGGRVYTRDIPPSATMELPYACVIADAGETDNLQRGLGIRYSFVIKGFVPHDDPTNAPDGNVGTQNACNLLDDLFEFTLQAEEASSALTVESGSFLVIPPPPGANWAEVRFNLRIGKAAVSYAELVA